MYKLWTGVEALGFEVLYLSIETLIEILKIKIWKQREDNF